MPRVEEGDPADRDRDRDPHLASAPPVSASLTLKRGRPSELRCPNPCLFRSKHAPSLAIDEQDPIILGPFPPQDDDEDFELGPPPPAPPMLCRQNAMDATATLQAKLSMARRQDARLSTKTAMASARVRGFVVAPAMAHASLSLPVLPN